MSHQPLGAAVMKSQRNLNEISMKSRVKFVKEAADEKENEKKKGNGGEVL